MPRPKAGAWCGAGTRRCKCKERGIYYTVDPKRHAYPEETRELAIKMYYGGISGRGVGKILGMNKSNVTKTMASRKPRQIVGHVVSVDKSSRTIQQMVDAAPEAQKCCTDGYSGYLDVVFPGKHIFNVHNKSDTFTVEGVNADLRHYIPTLARRRRCFPRKLENLQAVLTVFVRAYNRFGAQKSRYRSPSPFRNTLLLPPVSYIMVPLSRMTRRKARWRKKSRRRSS